MARELSFVLFCVVVFLLSTSTNVHGDGGKIATCVHTDDLDIPRHVHINKTTDAAQKHKRDANVFSEKFTISVTYDTGFDTSSLSASVRMRLQNNVIPKLVDFFESLSVRPTMGPLLFERDCNTNSRIVIDDFKYCANECESITTCGTATIPDNHLFRCRQCNDGNANDCEEVGSDGAGVDASYSLYISAENTLPCGGSLLAFAGFCEMEDEFDRPVAGYINFCPTAITDDRSDDYLLVVAKHELLHALGFSSSAYKWWRDENGDPRSSRDGNSFTVSNNTLKQVTYNDWDTFNGEVSHNVSLLVTPKIVEEGRRHFNCSTLEGVQVEDQGGSGTMGSHWEARITKGEGMNGVIANDGVFSRLTFALLEDSGWYKVNYTLAEQLIWARGAGCELAAGSCGGYMKSQQQQGKSISPFCDYENTQQLYRCDIKRAGISRCNRVNDTTEVPSEYQYFSNPFSGGSFDTADYCPFESAFSNTMCADVTNNRNGTDNIAAQTYGPDSRCVEHGTVWSAGGFQQTFIQSGCYKYTCSNGQVTIHILDQSYNCTSAGQEISVSQTSNGITYTGSFICPSCLEICYDDFENCPEAAQVYSEFVSTTSNDDSDSDSNSASESASTSSLGDSATSSDSNMEISATRTSSSVMSTTTTSSSLSSNRGSSTATPAGTGTTSIPTTTNVAGRDGSSETVMSFAIVMISVLIGLLFFAV